MFYRIIVSLSWGQYISDFYFVNYTGIHSQDRQFPLGLPLGQLNMTHSIKILNDDVKKNLLSLWLESGWTIAGKIAKEKYGIGYKTLMRTIKEFQKMGYKRNPMKDLRLFPQSQTPS